MYCVLTRAGEQHICTRTRQHTFCMTACTSSGFTARSLEKLSRERACQLSSTGSAKRAPSSSCSRASVLDRVAAWLGEPPLFRWALQTAETTESVNRTAASNRLCCSCTPVGNCQSSQCLGSHTNLSAYGSIHVLSVLTPMHLEGVATLHKLPDSPELRRRHGL